MNVMVTGCNGFIGRNICSLLKEKNYFIIGVDRAFTSNSNVDLFIDSDISKSSVISKVMEKVSECPAIVHTAAVISKDNFDRSLIDVNCGGALNVLELAVKIGCKKVINISSAPIIGFPQVHPIMEEHPAEPVSLYHITKLMQEQVFNTGDMYGISSINLRVPSPIGPGMNPKTILPVFLDRCMKNKPITIIGKGTRRQNYIDVRDIASAVEACIVSQSAKGCYNIGSPVTVSNTELAEKCIQLTGSSSEIIYSGTKDPEEGIVWDYSTAKAEEVFGFLPRYSIDDSIRYIIKKRVNES